MEKIKLVDEEVFDVKLIKSGIPYTSGERHKNNETYSRFRYDGIVFTVPDTDPFVKDWNDGEVAILKLLKTKRVVKDEDGKPVIKDGQEQLTDSIEFDSHVNSNQLVGVKTRSAKIKALESGVVDVKAVTKQDLEKAAF